MKSEDSTADTPYYWKRGNEMEHTLRGLRVLLGTLSARHYLEEMEKEIMEESKKAWETYMKDNCQKCYGASHAYKTVLGDREYP